MPSKITRISGDALTVAELWRIARDSSYKVRLDPKIKKRVTDSRSFLESAMRSKAIYGVNTGFGPMASHVVGRDQLVELQYNLIRSHAVGMGETIKPEYVLAAMVIRLNTLAKGYSGVTYPLLQKLETFINHRIIPSVPEHGAVGTSGDLTQLAHIAHALIGEGEVWYEGKRQKTRTVLRALRIRPYVLEPKEGLSLINGTSMMAGIGALACVDAERILRHATSHGALALELVGGKNDAISEELQRMRPHAGQMQVAQEMRRLVKGSKRLRTRQEIQNRVKIGDDVGKIEDDIQEIYSLRCIPQILGPVYDVCTEARKKIEIEINSVTDNPIVDWKKRTFLHGGNFHGDYIATAVDQLKIGLTKLTMLSERRINYFLHDRINEKFFPFLNLGKPGLTLALQGLQFVATSTTAQSQTLAYPHSLHSIPTNGDNQDIVSMGTDAALLTQKVIENAYIVLGIEAVTLTQGVDCINALRTLSGEGRKFFNQIRNIVPPVTDSINLHEQYRTLVSWLRNFN